MIRGGVGGANTQTGLRFELETDLPKFIAKQPGYKVIDNDFVIKFSTKTKRSEKIRWHKTFRWLVTYQDKQVAEIFQKSGLYRYFEEINLNYREIISKKLLPDDSIFVIDNNTVFIIEKKTQNGAGSVDEKLQTCDFKLKQFKKLFSKLNKEVKYYYLLDKWFQHPSYKDVLDYIISVGCDYRFEYLPLKEFGLPVPCES